MSVSTLRRLETKALSDDKVTEAEATELIDSARDGGRITNDEKAEISAFLSRSSMLMAPAARTLLSEFVSGSRPPAPSGDVVKSIQGSDKSSFEDDTIFLGRDGTVKGEGNVPAYSRSYAATKEGPLRFRHGSAAPSSSVNTAAENAALKTTTPGEALDEVAKTFGVQVNGFEAMANSQEFFNPSADYWWGKCHAWTWASLSTTIDKLVDVPGPDGQRGLWIAGQFLSRADLGNWMMAVADTISVNDTNQLMRNNLSALDVLKGTTEYMMNNGGGVAADVFNDKKQGKSEVWNQPFVAAELTTKSLTAAAAAAAAKKVLALASNEGITGGKQVKQVTIVGTYGTEIDDAHEGEPGRDTKTWVMYAVTDANGKTLTAYMADDEKLKSFAGLPTKQTDDVPEYFWKPSLQAIDDTLAGRRSSAVEWNAHGAEFKFFVGTVLKNGVPATTRTAFEKEIAALPAGAIDSSTADVLKSKYPNVANAYSPAQWERAFASRGLTSRTFGAAYP